MTELDEPPSEYELLRRATFAEIGVANSKINPTSASNRRMRSEGRLAPPEKVAVVRRYVAGRVRSSGATRA